LDDLGTCWRKSETGNDGEKTNIYNIYNIYINIYSKNTGKRWKAREGERERERER